MDRHAFDRDLDRIGGEALVLDRAGGLAVHRVAEIGAELLEIDLVDPAADLLVGGEEDADRAVPDVRVVDQELGRRHDLGDARLVVGAEQRGAVRGDDVVADRSFSTGWSATRMTWLLSPGSTMSSPR